MFLSGLKISGAKFGGPLLERFGPLGFDVDIDNIFPANLVDDGGTVRIKNWRDRLTNQNFFNSTMAQRPEYITNYHNGFACARFDSSANQKLGTGGGSTSVEPVQVIKNSSALTIFLVSKNGGFAQFAPGNDNELTSLCVNNAGVLRGVISAGSMSHGTKSGMAESGVSIKTLRFDGSQTGNPNRLRLFKNGVEVTSLTFTGTIPSATSNNATQCDIGRNNAGALASGDIMRILVYAAALSIDNIQSVTNVLNQKYQIF